MSLIYYPNPVFKQKALPVEKFDATLHHHISLMQATLANHRAIGIGANMCGILQRNIIVPLDESTQKTVMINPEIIASSHEKQTFLEASLSLPGIEASIERPQTISVTYQDTAQNIHEMTVSGFPATVIQHEIDYLNGIVFLDYLSKTKAKILKEKMKKYIKKMQRHAHHASSDGHHHHDGNCCHHKH